MERHKCKLCSRTFPNGRALGGHMKAHLATLPLPPKPQPFPSESSSFSYSSSESEQQQQQQQQHQVLIHSHRDSEEKGVIYGLRENPKKSFRVADPEFSFAAAPDTGSVVVQDRESETESKNPTRQRSKRKRRSSPNHNSEEQEQHKKPKLSFMESPPPQQPPPESEPVVSSVSDTSMVEDVAMFLVMLSRDKWFNKNVVKQDQHQEQEQQQEEEEREVKRSVVGSKVGGGCSSKGIKFKRVRGKHQCENCGKTFRSSRALGSHRSICCRSNESARGEGSDRVFECPFCFKVFGSGQALGGHKRSHLMGMASSSSTAKDSGRLNPRESFIDLNLPAPAEEEDDLGVVSDVSDA